MEPRDKFGNPIYAHVFAKIRESGRQLVALGYKETGTDKLFVCQYPTIAFIADMRGTKRVPLWTDPRPLMYVSDRDLPEQGIADAAWQIELSRLAAAGLLFRIDPRDSPM